MGMYTQLVLGVDLKGETPKEIFELLKYMCKGIPKNYTDSEGKKGFEANALEYETTLTIPNHKLFTLNRWRFMLRCDSAYFQGFTQSDIIQESYSKRYKLNVRTNLKNYEDEIETFLDWMTAYVEPDSQIAGYYMYEEFNKPTLIDHFCYNEVEQTTMGGFG